MSPRSLQKTRGEPLKWKFYVLRGDVERLAASDGCFCVCPSQPGKQSCNWLGNVHTANAKVVGESEVRRMRLERRLRRPDEVVAEQPPVGVTA